MIGAIFFHLLIDCRRNHIARLQLISEAVALGIEQDGSFATAGFRDKERAARVFDIQAGGMNLNAIHAFKSNAMLLGNAACIARKAGEVGGSLIAPPDTPCGKHGIGSTDKKATFGSFAAATVGAYNAHTTIPLRSLDDIGNLDMLQNPYIGKTADVFQQRGGDLFTRDITVIANTRTRMAPSRVYASEPSTSRSKSTPRRIRSLMTERLDRIMMSTLSARFS